MAPKPYEFDKVWYHGWPPKPYEIVKSFEPWRPQKPNIFTWFRAMYGPKTQRPQNPVNLQSLEPWMAPTICKSIRGLEPWMAPNYVNSYGSEPWMAPKPYNKL